MEPALSSPPDGQVERSSLLYAHEALHYKGGTWWCGFQALPEVASISGAEGAPVVALTVRDLHEGETSEYWAWWNSHGKKFEFVFPHRGGVSMCFPYGPEIEEAKGRGQVVNVFVERTTISTSGSSK